MASRQRKIGPVKNGDDSPVNEVGTELLLFCWTPLIKLVTLSGKIHGGHRWEEAGARDIENGHI